MTQFMKNGKLWEKVWVECWRCSGKGRIEPYAHVHGGICFKCNDERGYWQERRVLSDKEKAQRERAKERKEARREAQRQENMIARNEEFKAQLGFVNGIIHVVAVKNTFSIKDDLKEQGAKFNRELGWYFSEAPDNYPTIQISDEEAIIMAEGYLEFNPDVERIIRSKMAEIMPQSHWVGDIKDKVELELTFKRSFGFEGQFGYSYIYIFEDDDHNIFKWSTGKSISLDEEDRVRIKGTIKGHTEYRDEKQTELTRCKIEAL